MSTASSPPAMNERTDLVLFLGSFGNDKKYKENILHEIKSAICAMLNSNGGNVMIHIDTDSSIPVEGTAFVQPALVIRILEQSMISIIGSQQTVSKIDFSMSNEEDEESIVVSVHKADSLVTMNYNLCLPSKTQVVPVCPTELPDHIINRTIIEDPNELGSHWKIFRKDEICGLPMENKVIQFKNLKAGPSKRTTLADRMTGKGNRFSCYVSAFANHRGGHIYYGITDDGVVKGEFVPNEKDKEEILKKVNKAINKMIWPEQTGQPKRGEHWEIFFEPVLDENSKPVPSTFVIVIFIASCLGGVFTEQPECYEMVGGIVSKMSFAEWRKRILVPGQSESVPREITRSLAWNSKTIKELCTKVFFGLTLPLNNGDLPEFERVKAIANKSPHVEVKLIVLLKDILAHSRKHEFETASRLLEEYKRRLPNVSELRIFEVLILYVEAAYNRAKATERNALLVRDLLVKAVALSEWLEPGLVTSLVYLFAGTMTDRFDNTHLHPPNELSNKALQHLQHVTSDNSDVHAHADLRYKAYITNATSHLGFNLSGELIAQRIDNERIGQAKSSIDHIKQSSAGNNSKLTHYRTVQLKLVESFYYFRCSQNQPEERERFMREALKFSKDAKNLAEKWNFHEMVSWSETVHSLLLKHRSNKNGI
jgi:hypothetical protein